MTATAIPDVVTTAARQGALGLAGAVLAGVGGLVLTVVVSRMLPHAEAGIYFTAVAAFTITSTVLVLGTDTGLVRALAGARAAGTPQLLRPYLRVALVPVLLAAAAVAVAAWLLADPISRALLGGAGDEQRELAHAVRLLCPFLVVATISTLLLGGAARGLGSLRTYTAVQQVFLPGSRPVLVASALLGSGLIGGALGGAGALTARTAQPALLAWALPLVVALVIAVREVRRLLPAPHPTDRTAPLSTALDSTGRPEDLGRRFWRSTAPRALAATFEVLIVWADVVVVTALIGPVAGGTYAAASRFVTSGSFALQAVRLSIGPLLAGAFTRSDVAQAAQVHRLSMRWAILSTWPVYLAMAAFAPGVLALLGPGYAQAAPALTVLCLTMLAVVATGNANTVLNMAHRSHWAAANTGTATALMLAVDLLLVPRIGILGAAIGWSAAMLTDAVLSSTEVRIGLGLRSLDRSVAEAALVVLGAFALPAALLRGLTDVLAPTLSALGVLIGGTATCATLYAVALYGGRRRLALGEIVAALRRRPDQGPPSAVSYTPTGRRVVSRTDRTPPDQGPPGGTS